MAESKTNKGTRIAILCVAVFMLVSTVALYASAIMGGSSTDTDSSDMSDEELAHLQEIYNEYAAKVEEQRVELSNQYFDKFSPYKSEVKAFNAASVTELKTRDILEGDGELVAEGTPYHAYYIGWLSDETIFDSSLNDTSLNSPVGGGDFIEGWTQGVLGMKIGGVREITIPSAMGYGETGSGEVIPANAPLRFIVMLIPSVEEVPIPEELLAY